MQERPTALITGGTRGFGRALAEELAASHHLYIGGSTPAAVARVCAELPGASPFVADLRDERATREAAASIERLDVLVHSAGVCPVRRLEDASREDWRDVFELNVVAVADLTRLLLPALRAASGMVVMINSGAGLRGSAELPVYAASKFALTGLTQSLKEAERGRVRVVSVHPGRMDTDMQREMYAGWDREYRGEEHMDPVQVARVVAAAIRTPAGATVDVLEIRPS